MKLNDDLPLQIPSPPKHQLCVKLTQAENTQPGDCQELSSLTFDARSAHFKDQNSDIPPIQPQHALLRDCHLSGSYHSSESSDLESHSLSSHEAYESAPTNKA